MTLIAMPRRIDARRAPQLLEDLWIEKERLRTEAASNLAARVALVEWWLKRPSGTMSFFVIEPATSTAFSDQLGGLVGEQNFAQYRRWRNATLYLLPRSAHVHLVKMLPDARSLKEVNNRNLLLHRRGVNGTWTRPLPWETGSPSLIWAQRMSELNLSP